MDGHHDAQAGKTDSGDIHLGNYWVHISFDKITRTKMSLFITNYLMNMG